MLALAAVSLYNDRMLKMNICKIANMEIDGNFTRIYLLNGESFLVDFWFIDSTVDYATKRFTKGTLSFTKAANV